MTSSTCRRCEISKKLTWNPTLMAKNTLLFLFPYMGPSLHIFAWGMPLHAHVFSFTHNAVVLSHFLDVFTPKIRWFLILTCLWIKTNVAYTKLEVIAKQRSALQVEFITGVKLICYFVLYYCFLRWAHLPDMAVGDLVCYYTLYIYVQYLAVHIQIPPDRLRGSYITQYQCGSVLQVGVLLMVLYEGTMQLSTGCAVASFTVASKYPHSTLKGTQQ